MCVPSGSELETDDRWPRSDEAESLLQGFSATNALPATKISLKVGRRFVQLEFDTAHISASHSLKQITRMGSRPGCTRKRDMTIAEYWEAANLQPIQEIKFLLKDLQDDVDAVNPWLDTIGICPPPPSVQGNGKMKAGAAEIRQASAGLMQTRHTYYKYGDAVLMNSAIVLLENDAMGAFSSWSEEAKQSAVLATAVSCVQTANTIINWVGTRDRLTAAQIVLLRLTVGSIRRFRAAIGESVDLRPPEGCQNWDELFNFLPGAKSVSPTAMSAGRRTQTPTSLKLENIESQKGLRWDSTTCDEDTMTNNYHLLLARGEQEWEKQVKTDLTAGERKDLTLRVLLEKAGIKGNDPIRMG